MNKKSTFITVISWLYIVIFGFITLMSAFQLSILVSFMKNQADSFPGGIPSFSIINLEINPIVGFIGMFLLNIIVIFASIMLLKRKNIGRIIISIYNSLFSVFIILQLILGKSKFDEAFSSDSTMSAMYSSMKIGMAIFSSIMVLLAIFIIYMINRKSVRYEFDGENEQHPVIES